MFNVLTFNCNCSKSATEATNPQLSDSCSFVSHGTNQRGVNPYDQPTMTATECRTNCFSDSRCNGYTHKSSTHNCRLHETTQYQSTSCSDCSFFSKVCDTTTILENPTTQVFDTCTFVFRGTSLQGVSHYSQVTVTATECRTNCFSDTRCNGYTHKSSTNYCRLHETTQYQTTTCSACSFFAKLCDTTTSIQIPTTQTISSCSFVFHGTSLHGVSYYSLTTITATECRTNCFSDTRCNGYTHKSSTDRCRLHETTQYQSISCSDCSFYSKVCDTTTTIEAPTAQLPDSCSFVSHGTNQRGVNPYHQPIMTATECRTNCFSDTRCNGYTHKSSTNNCRLHETTQYQSTSCSDCSFFSKTCDTTTTTEATNPQLSDSCSFVSHGTNQRGMNPYDQPTMTATECRTNCFSDSRCNGYTHKSSTHNCRLHETTQYQSTSCSDCSFFSKVCDTTTILENPTTQVFDTCTFVFRGTSLQGVSHYSQVTVTATECRTNCFSDTRCNGYTHKSSTNYCRLHETTQYQTTTCSACSFFAKLCDTTTSIHIPTTQTIGSCSFVFHGTSLHGVSYYSLTTITATECRTNCFSDTRCNGYTHKSSTDRCRLHETTQYQSISCSDCSFYSKVCETTTTIENPTTQVFDTCTFVFRGTSLHGVSYYSQVTVTATECRTNCFSDTRCNGYTHKSNTNYCRLHETTQYQSTSCSACSFFDKVCDTTTSIESQTSQLSDSCIFISHGTNQSGVNPYDQPTMTATECRTNCFSDSRCNGYTHESSTNYCRLHETTQNQSTSCSDCSFFSKVCDTITLPTTASHEPPDCLVTSFIDHGSGTNGFNDRTISVTNSSSDCQTLCENNSNCRVFVFENGNGTCSLNTKDMVWQTLSQSTCEEQCRNDETCKGYSYKTSTHACALGNLDVSRYGSQSINFFAKKCGSEIHPTTCHGASYFQFGPYHRVQRDETQHSSNSFMHCRSACLNDVSCRDYRYNKTGRACRLSATEFMGRIARSLLECEMMCSEDIHCFSYYFKTDTKRCRMSYLNTSMEVSWCDSCMFSVKQCVHENSSYLLNTTAPEVCYDYYTIGMGISSTYSVLHASTWTECEMHCSNNDNCNSYQYNKNGSNACLLSQHTTPNASCPSCSFAFKRPCEITTSISTAYSKESTDEYPFTSMNSNTRTQTSTTSEGPPSLSSETTPSLQDSPPTSSNSFKAKTSATLAKSSSDLEPQLSSQESTQGYPSTITNSYTTQSSTNSEDMSTDLETTESISYTPLTFSQESTQEYPPQSTNSYTTQSSTVSDIISPDVDSTPFISYLPTTSSQESTQDSSSVFTNSYTPQSSTNSENLSPGLETTQYISHSSTAPSQTSTQDSASVSTNSYTTQSSPNSESLSPDLETTQYISHSSTARSQKSTQDSASVSTDSYITQRSTNSENMSPDLETTQYISHLTTVSSQESTQDSSSVSTNSYTTQSSPTSENLSPDLETTQFISHLTTAPSQKSTQDSTSVYTNSYTTQSSPTSESLSPDLETTQSISYLPTASSQESTQDSASVSTNSYTPQSSPNSESLSPDSETTQSIPYFTTVSSQESTQDFASTFTNSYTTQTSTNSESLSPDSETTQSLSYLTTVSSQESTQDSSSVSTNSYTTQSSPTSENLSPDLKTTQFISYLTTAPSQKSTQDPVSVYTNSYTPQSSPNSESLSPDSETTQSIPYFTTVSSQESTQDFASTFTNSYTTQASTNSESLSPDSETTQSLSYLATALSQTSTQNYPTVSTNSYTTQSSTNSENMSPDLETTQYISHLTTVSSQESTQDSSSVSTNSNTTQSSPTSESLSPNLETTQSISYLPTASSQESTQDSASVSTNSYTPESSTNSENVSPDSETTQFISYLPTALSQESTQDYPTVSTNSYTTQSLPTSENVSPDLETTQYISYLTTTPSQESTEASLPVSTNSYTTQSSTNSENMSPYLETTQSISYLPTTSSQESTKDSSSTSTNSDLTPDLSTTTFSTYILTRSSQESTQDFPSITTNVYTTSQTPTNSEDQSPDLKTTQTALYPLIASSQESTHDSLSTFTNSYATTQTLNHSEDSHFSSETTESATRALITESATRASTTESATRASTTESATRTSTTESATRASTTESATRASTTEYVGQVSTEKSVSSQHLSKTTNSFTTTNPVPVSNDLHPTSDTRQPTTYEATVTISSSQDSSQNPLFISTNSYSTTQTEAILETVFSDAQTTKSVSQTSTERDTATQGYAEVKQISNGTVKCTCICQHNNYTLEEAIELRKQTLLVKKTQLSSTIRKLTSAPDVRHSSAVMGKLGIAVIGMVAGLLTFADICSVSLFICNVFKKHVKCQLMSKDEEKSRMV